MSTTRNQKIIRMVELAMLIALIFVMQYLGTLASTPLRTIGIEFSFVLIPIVVGAFLLGPVEGAILGFVFGAMTVVLTVIAPGTMTYILFTERPVLYVIVAMVKAIAAGLGSGLIYKGLDKLMKGKAVYLRTVLAAATAPIINTGIFLLGMVCFFSDVIAEKWAGGTNIFLFLVGLIWINFIIEVGINIVLSPAIVRIVDAVKKKAKK
ncbi:MAG: ECF transporter S component [Clostridia bacterium]|nr:ECF transporter S component [Clostridia bacterium]